MRPADDIYKMIKKLQLKASVELDKRVHDDISRAPAKPEKTRPPHPELDIWGTFVKSRTAKFAAAAAAVVMIVLGGVTFWPGGNSQNGKWWLGSPAAWGQEIIAKMDKIEALVYRQQMVFMGPDITHVSGTWRRIYEAADRSREETYYGRAEGNTFRDNRQGSVLVEVTWKVPEGKDLKSYRISHEYKCYAIKTSEGAAYTRDPMKWLRSCVGTLDKADRKLGTRTLEGRECVGFEIDVSRDGDTPKGRTDRIWLDVETKLPVRVEFSNGKLILDQFKYHVQIPAEEFEPKIPDGFINADPDEIRAAKEIQRKERVAGTVSEAGEQSGKSVSTVQDQDIAIDDSKLTLTEQPDGSFRAEIAIWNKGSRPLPQFGVNFYAGDPDKGGRLLAPHSAGPIMPGDGWGEYDPDLKLRPGETVISVVVDPGNKVEESDETNNKASQVIPGRQSRQKTESAKVDIAIGHGNFIVTKLSDRVFEVTIIIRNRGSVPLPRFKVNFYAGDPDKGGRLLSPQNAGPIMPGDIWAEHNPGLGLRPGENVISVVLDPDNKVEESDETNNKVSRKISTIVSESKDVDKVGAIRKVDLSGDDILQVEAQVSEGFNFPYYLFIPGGIDKHSPVYLLVEPNNSGMVSDDPEVHQAKALALVKKSHANRMARQLGVPLLIPTFPRPRPETHSWAYTHALDIDTLEIEEGKLKRVDLQLTAMIKHAQELLRTNGFSVNDKVFMHGFSASAKFCNRYSYLHPEMVKAAAAGGVNGLPTLPVREWNGYELPFPIGLTGIERFASKPFDEKAFMQVAHYIYMGSSDRNDTLLSREAWREEEADIIRKALAAPKMMPDRWELSRKIYRQQKLPAQLVTYNGVGHSIKSQMLDDVIDFFKANAGEKYVPIEPYEYPSVDPDDTARGPDEKKSKASQVISGRQTKDKPESAKVDIAIDDESLRVTRVSDGLFRAGITIYNKGSAPSPKFEVYFYAGDPDKGGRLLAPHGAGPIMPGDIWREGTHPHRLQPGENTISVVVDPRNKVKESDETNNKASQVIPGRQTKTPEISEKPKDGRMRYFVRLVVGKDKMTFQGQEVIWEELPPLLEKVPNRHHTVFQIASNSGKDFFYDQDKKTTSYSAEFDEMRHRARELCHSFGFEYFSFTGVHPLGTKGKSPEFVPHKK